MPKKPLQDHSVCVNRKATHRYEILQKIECGVVLRGAEVKSVREGAVSLDEAYARIEADELWLIGCHIAPYSHSATADQEALRRRKLLARRSEIRRLRAEVERAGRTLVPLQLYFNDRGMAKMLLAVAEGKRFADKREALKRKEHKREMERATRRRR